MPIGICFRELPDNRSAGPRKVPESGVNHTRIPSPGSRIWPTGVMVLARAIAHDPDRPVRLDMAIASTYIASDELEEERGTGLLCIMTPHSRADVTLPCHRRGEVLTRERS
jgi:hypothetical protein